MVEFNKSVLDDTFKAISSIQDDSMSMLTATSWTRSPGCPLKGKKQLPD